jgi:hypothetical protein
VARVSTGADDLRFILENSIPCEIVQAEGVQRCVRATEGERDQRGDAEGSDLTVIQISCPQSWRSPGSD